MQNAAANAVIVYGHPYNMNAKKLIKKLHKDKKQIYGGRNREEYRVEPLPKKITPMPVNI